MVRKKTIKLFMLALSLVYIQSFPPSVLAESTIRFIPSQKIPTPDKKGTPDNDTGTGSRSQTNCPQKDIPLTPLVGGKENLELTLTTSTHPTFWFYVPYTAEEVVSGEFYLQDQEGNNIFETKITLPTEPGIIGISLPPEIKPLEINYQYRWYLVINCPEIEGENNSSPAWVEGLVQKIPQEQITTFSTLPPLERIEIYAENGIWYDTLTELAKLKIAQPNSQELITIWSNLLNSSTVGLETVSQKPILGIINNLVISP